MLEAEDLLSGRADSVSPLPPGDDLATSPSSDIVQLPPQFTQGDQIPNGPDVQDVTDQIVDEPRDLFFNHYGLAAGIAQRYEGKGVPIEDLRQVAAEGLLKAVRRFDAKRFDVEFSTFAYKNILGAVIRYFRDNGWGIRPTRRVQEDLQTILGSVDQTTQLLGHQPNAAELAASLDMSEQEVSEALRAGLDYNVDSTDQVISADTETTIGDNITDGNLLEGRTIDQLEVERLLDILDPRSRRMLVLSYVHGLSQLEIAEEFGESQVHVAKLIRAARRKLQNAAKR